MAAEQRDGRAQQRRRAGDDHARREPRAGGERARQVSRRSLERTRGGASRTTVLVALASNATVFLAKLVAGLMSGSAALLAEAAHSLADTVNQGFLLVSIKLAAREPTEEQPFGHGRQRFLWTFVAAVSMFVAGSVFAVGYGLYELFVAEESGGGFAAAWVALGIATVAEGVSWARALRQTRAEARERGTSLLRHVRASRDPSVKMVLFEDTAALLGVAIAAAGIGLHQATGDGRYDSVASVVIGLMLIGVAMWMAHDTGELLSGASARPDEREQIERVLEQHPDVREVVQLLTMVLGPNALLVAARIDISDQLDGAAVERVATELDQQLRDAVPDVTEVFLDATDADAPDTAVA